MLRTTLLAITFLACAAWMAAQSTPPSAQSSGSSGSTAGSQTMPQTGSQSGSQTGQTGSENGQTPGAPGASGQTNNASQTKLRGCINSSGGGYTLTDASGTQYQLTGDTAKLSQHVNNEVEVRGSTSGGSAYGNTSPGSQASTSPAGAAPSGPMFNVTKVKKISNTCNAGTTGGTNR